MAESKITVPERVVERNLALTSVIMRYLIEKPQVFENLPNNFELVVLPEGDTEMWVYNLHLMDKASQEGKPIIFAVLNLSKVSARGDIPASLYTPIPV